MLDRSTPGWCMPGIMQYSPAMEKLTAKDVRGPRLYEGFRDDLRKRVAGLEVQRVELINQ